MSGESRQADIAPSLLSADFSKLGAEIAEVEKGGCRILHVDVMDGHFVPNLTIGPPVVRSIRKVTRLILDVHLMIENPLMFIPEFKKAGADWITIHAEPVEKLEGTLRAFSGSGIKRGVSVKPGTPVEILEPYLEELDLILIMTVEPGFGGQAFMPEPVEKIRWLRPRFSGIISVDGGVNIQNAAMIRDAGADVLVAGTSVFGQPDRVRAMNELRGIG